jgi:hypothetical protein
MLVAITSSPDPIQCAAVLRAVKARPGNAEGCLTDKVPAGLDSPLRAPAARFGGRDGRMLAARVEPKNGPKENKKSGKFKPLVFDEFQTGVPLQD